MKNHQYRKLHWTFVHNNPLSFPWVTKMPARKLDFVDVFLEFWSFCIKKVDRPTLKKPKIENFGRPPLGANIFFRNSVEETFFRTLRSSSGVKIEGNRRRLLLCVVWERAAFSRYMF
jgi:hypothetical protein